MKAQVKQAGSRVRILKRRSEQAGKAGRQGGTGQGRAGQTRQEAASLCLELDKHVAFCIITDLRRSNTNSASVASQT